MKYVKIFDCESEKDLERQINDFSKKLEEENNKIIDIKYQANCSIGNDNEQIYIYSALIIYGDKQ